MQDVQRSLVPSAAVIVGKYVKNARKHLSHENKSLLQLVFEFSCWNRSVLERFADSSRWSARKWTKGLFNMKTTKSNQVLICWSHVFSSCYKVCMSELALLLFSSEFEKSFFFWKYIKTNLTQKTNKKYSIGSFWHRVVQLLCPDYSCNRIVNFRAFKYLLIF